MTDFRNPLTVVIPHVFNSQPEFPTEVIALRFQAYRDIIKDIVSYLEQYALVQEEIVRQQVRLHQAVGTASSPINTAEKAQPYKSNTKHSPDKSFDTSLFFLPLGNGSIQDVPSILTKFHQQNILNGKKTLKELNLVIIPKLEDLRKDLLIKIKEIKNLQNDFKNSISKEMNESRILINNFNHAIDIANHLEVLNTSSADASPESESMKRDPYLAKLKLERQLKRQLSEESYLFEAYKNLQTSSEKLESIVVLEIQNFLSIFLSMVETENSAVSKFLVPNLSNGFLSKEPNFEWDSFIERNLPHSSAISNNLSTGKFIDLSFPARKLADLSIPHYDSLVNVPVRQGWLERRSKFLKSYSRGWFVLTCSYLHEFKTQDRKRDQTPVMSLPLDYCLVSDHSKNDGKASGAYKFVLYSKLLSSLMHRSHNWALKCDTYQSMIDWFEDIKTLTSVSSPSGRAKIMSKKLIANNALQTKSSRVSSIVSAHTGVGSLRTANAASSPKYANQLSGIASSGRTSLSTGGLNDQASSTFSQRESHSPRVPNLINSDGTVISQDRSTVDMHGDLIIKAPRSTQAKEYTGQDHGFGGPELGFGGQEHGFTGPEHQSIPQSYQYYLNLVNQERQRFFDPVLQQFYVINAVPAPQGSMQEHNNGMANGPPTVQVNGHLSANQPMPQYFPSSPLPTLMSRNPSVQNGDPYPAPAQQLYYGEVPGMNGMVGSYLTPGISLGSYLEPDQTVQSIQSMQSVSKGDKVKREKLTDQMSKVTITDE